MIQDLLNTEMCFSTREQICSIYKMIFYGREDPKMFIDPMDFDSIVKVYLESIEFNHSALGEVLESLCTEKHDSPFYKDVKCCASHIFRLSKDEGAGSLGYARETTAP
uniref:Orf154 n=1 Tax=Petunia parodii TaxID=55890 RepID=Q35612_PETPA|nr:orf154 [Petunia axillaris subsp. parodii]